MSGHIGSTTASAFAAGGHDAQSKQEQKNGDFHQ